ncbi:MAG: hypothetical protein IH795_11955 [Bacteroidetes bacterium]|nr:hypothetical protein [Bacteroidota bacterium]
MIIERTSYQLANQVRFFGKEISELLEDVICNDVGLHTTLEEVVIDLESVLVRARKVNQKVHLCDH